MVKVGLGQTWWLGKEGIGGTWSRRSAWSWWSRMVNKRRVNGQLDGLVSLVVGGSLKNEDTVY